MYEWLRPLYTLYISDEWLNFTGYPLWLDSGVHCRFIWFTKGVFSGAALTLFGAFLQTFYTCMEMHGEIHDFEHSNLCRILKCQATCKINLKCFVTFFTEETQRPHIRSGSQGRCLGFIVEPHC